jgi:hypothetical protein
MAAACLAIQGDVKAQPSVGPLYFDVSSQGYDTTTRQPERGWTEAYTGQDGPDRGNLRTVVSFDINDNGAQSGALTFGSHLWSVDKVNTLEYEISNESGVPLRVLINLPTTPQFTKEVPIAEEPLELTYKQAVVFKTVTGEPVRSGVFSILITTLDGHVIGLDSGSFWFPADGKLLRTSADLWSRAVRPER